MIEKVHLRRRAGLRQPDHALGFRREMGNPPPGRRLARGVALQERGQSCGPDADRAMTQEKPAGRERVGRRTRAWRALCPGIYCFGDRFVEVQQCAGHRRQCGQLGGVDRRIGGGFPTFSSFGGGSGIGLKFLQRPLVRGDENVQLGACADCDSAHSGSRRASRWAGRVAPFAHHALRQDAGRFHVGRVVHQVERLQRRVRSAAAARCRSRGTARRTAAASDSAPTASSTCRGCGDRDRSRDPSDVGRRHVGRDDLLVNARRLIGLHRRPADLRRPTGRSPPGPGRAKIRPAAGNAGPRASSRFSGSRSRRTGVSRELCR